VLLSCLAAVPATTLTGRQGPGDASKSRTSAEPVQFRNIAKEAGVEVRHINGASSEKFLAETMSAGGLFLDYDNDGWLDLVLIDGGSLADRQVAAQARHRLFRNRGDGTFENVTASSGLRHREYGMGGCSADFDNDGWADLYVTNLGPNVLYRNNGKGSFDDVTKVAGVGSPLFSTSCAFVDVDRDGDLDLFVANYVDATADHNMFCSGSDPTDRTRLYCNPLVYQGQEDVLYRNMGNGTFIDISREAGLGDRRGNGLGVAVGDYDADGWPDIFVANDGVPNFLYHNQGGGVFTETGLLAGVAVASDGKARAGMGTDFGDIDGDGLLDLFVTNHELERHTLFRNLGRGLFQDVTSENGIGLSTLPFVGFGTAFLDYDNDADLDLAIVNGHVLTNPEKYDRGSRYAQRNLLFRNDGGGRLTEVGRLSGPGFALEKVSRALAVGDIDRDGDLDLLVTNNGQTVDLLRNDGGSRQNAVLIHLVGTKSNRDGIGARLRVTVGGKTQIREVKSGSSYLAQNDLRAHVGLGLATAVERVEIRWPAGGTEILRDLPVNHILTIVEGKGVTNRVPFVRP
jgi:enediyne biosynthesis protein E4